MMWDKPNTNVVLPLFVETPLILRLSLMSPFQLTPSTTRVTIIVAKFAIVNSIGLDLFCHPLGCHCWFPSDNSSLFRHSRARGIGRSWTRSRFDPFVWSDRFTSVFYHFRTENLTFWTYIFTWLNVLVVIYYISWFINYFIVFSDYLMIFVDTYRMNGLVTILNSKIFCRLFVIC